MRYQILAMLVTFLSWLAPMAQAEKSAWQGVHLSYGVTTQKGDHDFILSHEPWGTYEVWALPLLGKGSVAELGYRSQIGQSFTIGPTVSLMRGSLSGALEWPPEIGVSAGLVYESEIQATAGLELAFILSERLLLSLEGGAVASDAQLTLSGAYSDYSSDGSSLSGYVPGHYVAVGIDYRFNNGATIEFEVGQYTFDCADSLDQVNGKMTTDATVASISFGWQF